MGLINYATILCALAGGNTRPGRDRGTALESVLFPQGMMMPAALKVESWGHVRAQEGHGWQAYFLDTAGETHLLIRRFRSLRRLRLWVKDQPAEYSTTSPMAGMY